MVTGMGAAAQMGAGAATLITIAAVAVGLILLERWQVRRARRRADRRAAADRGESDSEGATAGGFAGALVVWRWLFGPAPGEEKPYDPMQDVHPDELEGQYDGDPPPRDGV